MTHKELLSELHKASRLDRQQVSAFVSALCRVLVEEAISGNVVSVEGLGQFISHKHPEYIQTNDETGETILYPPRISFRFSPLQNFPAPADTVSLLAENAGVVCEDSATFLSAFASVITSVLSRGEDVEVLGLGRFTMVDTNQAEMRRIALILSETIKREVNSPFAFFEPFVISEGVKVKEEVTEKEEEIKAEEKTPEATVEETADAEKAAAEISAEFLPENSSPEGDAPQLGELSVAQGKTLGQESEKKAIPQRGKLSKLLKFVLPILSFILLSIIYRLFWKSEPEPIPEAPVVVAEEVIEEETPEIVADTLQEEETVEETPAPIIEEKKPEKVAEIVPAPAPDTNPGLHRMKDSAGNPVAVKLAPGGRLTLVSLEHFGSKDFWPYIFDVNSDRLSSPNNVSAGMTLYLPDPEYFDIDAASEVSLKKARQRGHDINKK